MQPCSSVSTDVRTSVGPFYTGTPIDLSVSSSGDTASVPPQDILFPGTSGNINFSNPASFDPAGYTDQTITVKRNGADTAADTFTISLTPTGPPGLSATPATITVTNAPPTISRITWTNDSPLQNGSLNNYAGPNLGLNPYNLATVPEGLASASEVTIDGSGFCPGSVVEFGNQDAIVTADSVNSSGTELTARLPATATTGPVTVGSGGSLTPGMSAIVPQSDFPSADKTPGLQVDSYRDTRGFSFHNFTPNIQDQDMQNAFGFNAVYDSVDVCAIGCTVSFFNPLAKILEWVAQDTIGNPNADGGACFGFSLGSYELIGVVPGSVGYFTVNPAVYQLRQNDPSGLGYTVHDLIAAAALKQFSSQFLVPYLSAFAAQKGQGSSAAAVSVYNEIKAILSAGRPAMISLTDGSGGHVVDAYQLVGTPPDYSIDVYDSNDPFSFYGDEDSSDGTYHQQQLTHSRINVTGGGWSLQSTSLQGQIADFGLTHDSALVVTDPANIPFNPTPISDLSALVSSAGAGLQLIFGGDAGATPTTDDASVITQVADPAGHTLFNTQGNVNTDPRTRLLGAPFPRMAGDDRSAPKDTTGSGSLVLSAGAASTLQTTVHDTGTGPDAHTILDRGFAAIVSTHARPGAVDHFSTSSTEASFSTTAPRKPLTVTLLDSTGAGKAQVARTIQLTTTTFGHMGDGISVINGGRGVQITHRGPATTASLTLSAESADSLPQTFTTPPMRIAKNGADRITDISWKALQNSTIAVSQAGRTVTVRNTHTVNHVATISALRAKRLPGDEVALSITSQVRRLPAGATRDFVWTVRRGGREVTSHTVVEGARTKSGVFTFHAKARGTYTFTGIVVVTTSGTAESASMATRKLTFRS